MTDPEDDSRTDKVVRRRRNLSKDGRCTLCPPHAGENARRYRKAKRGARKPKPKRKQRRRQ